MSSPEVTEVIRPQKGRRVLDEGERSERISMALTEEEVAELDAWMFHYKQRTRSEAIRKLMRIGYEATAKPVRLIRQKS